MQIAIIGSGYVGLVTGACLADFGHHVTCVDKVTEKIALLQAGGIPIYEPGLEALVERNVNARRLFFTTDLAGPVGAADVVFIAVGTPSRRGDGYADLSYVYDAAREVAGALQGFTVVATKSTVPVGTGDEVEFVIRKANPKADVTVVSNPEFLREGAAIEDFKRPDRIVVGVCDDARARDVMEQVYRPLFLNRSPILFTGRRTSEMIKYSANAFLAMKVTFINEIADLCELVGANVQDVARGIGLDNRIGSKFLNAGPGYGGSCFPKDTLALVKTAQDIGAPLRLIETTVAINDQRKRAMARKVVMACGGDVRGKRVAALGLTFKPNTDDMREAPSVSILQALVDLGAKVSAYDPAGLEQARSVINEKVTFAADPYDCVRDAHVVVIITEWDEFRALDLAVIALQMASPVMVDLRNIYRRDDVVRHGFHYVNLGDGSGEELHPISIAAE